jgi:hypothetical protein
LLTWTVDTLEVYVAFDHTGHACMGLARERKPVGLDLLSTIVWRAKRQWHRWFPE